MVAKIIAFMSGGFEKKYIKHVASLNHEICGPLQWGAWMSQEVSKRLLSGL